jgi:hypothetical protein
MGEARGGRTRNDGRGRATEGGGAERKRDRTSGGGEHEERRQGIRGGRTRGQERQHDESSTYAQRRGGRRAPEEEKIDLDCVPSAIGDVAIHHVYVARGGRAVRLQNPAKVVELSVRVAHHHDAPVGQRQLDQRRSMLPDVRPRREQHIDREFARHGLPATKDARVGLAGGAPCRRRARAPGCSLRCWSSRGRRGSAHAEEAGPCSRRSDRPRV